MNRREYLQAIADATRTDDQHEFDIEFRPFNGWWAVASESRWFGDNGEYLGATWWEAEKTLRVILG